MLTVTRTINKAASSGTNFLYTTEYNYMDFSVDDNGLWVIYTTADSNNTNIAKVPIHKYLQLVNCNLNSTNCYFL